MKCGEKKLTEYTIIGYRELETKETRNLFDAIDIIKRMEKKGLTVSVVHGPLTDAEEFTRRVRRIYQ